MCKFVRVFLSVCQYMYHPCHIHVHEWRILMLPFTQEILLHLKEEVHTSHTCTVTYEAREHDTPYSHHHHNIPHSMPPIPCFPAHKLVRTMTDPLTDSLNNVSSIILSSILSSTHTSFFFLLYIIPFAHPPFFRHSRTLDTPEYQALGRKLCDSGR